MKTFNARLEREKLLISELISTSMASSSFFF